MKKLRNLKINEKTRVGLWFNHFVLIFISQF